MYPPQTHNSWFLSASSLCQQQHNKHVPPTDPQLFVFVSGSLCHRHNKHTHTHKHTHTRTHKQTYLHSYSHTHTTDSTWSACGSSICAHRRPWQSSSGGVACRAALAGRVGGARPLPPQGALAARPLPSAASPATRYGQSPYSCQ